MLRWLGTVVALAGLLAGLVVGCNLSGVRVPPGGQQVHVVGTGTEVRLDPPTVHAGDIYLVIEGSALFFQSSAAVQGEQSGPMSEDHLTRLAQSGDTFHTWSTELSPGYAGNVYKYTLAAGKYAFVPVPDEERPGAALDTPPVKVAVLEVLP